MNNQIAVIIADVHYSLNTLELADAAMRQAIAKANELQVPLIVAGDLHDTKANMRAECVNAMIETFKLCNKEVFILRGNHDSVHEKSEEHALNFLASYTTILDKMDNVIIFDMQPIHLIPYQYNTDVLKTYLMRMSKGAVIVMHQGIQGSNMGDYIQDKTAIPREWCVGLRVISGHYHARQDIICPDGGLFSYVGNPYTLSFGEAHDPEKGYQILNSDGSMEFVPTCLRKHVICEFTLPVLSGISVKSYKVESADLLAVRLTGTREQLQAYDRQRVAKELGLGMPFKLDLIPLASETTAPKNSLNQNDLLDSIIDSMTNTTDERKARLKSMWKDLL